MDEARLDSEICKVCYIVLLKYYSKWEYIRMAEERLDTCDLSSMGRKCGLTEITLAAPH